MPQITHLSLKVNDVESATALYENVFGFEYQQTLQANGHISRQLSKNGFSLVLMQYESEQSSEALLAGPGPCIHHFGVEVDDMQKYEDAIRNAGCEIIGGSAEKPPIKFRTPDGIIAELQPAGKFSNVGAGGT